MDSLDTERPASLMEPGAATPDAMASTDVETLEAACPETTQPASLLPPLFSTPFTDLTYRSPEFQAGPFSRLLPSLLFYSRMGGTVYTASKKANAGEYSDEDWAVSSLSILRDMEQTGGRLLLEGMEHVRGMKEPCLFIGNHMSTLETFLLPGIIRPFKPVTFVVKESLLNYPLFGPIMRSRDPIAVGRANPRDDLSAVLDGGMERLQKGISLIIFPQSTRMETFDPEQFNTIGLKLARKAGVPIIPVALRTKFWGNGTLLKDFGPVRPESTAHIRFGAPLALQGNGKREHASIIDFIQASLDEWNSEDAASASK